MVGDQPGTPVAADGDDDKESKEEEAHSRCPYIVGMHDAYVDTQDTTIDLVLEYMDGGSVQDRIDSHGPLSEAEVAVVLHCALRGLRHLHDSRRLHRDIKPGNLVMTASST